MGGNGVEIAAVWGAVASTWFWPDALIRLLPSVWKEGERLGWPRCGQGSCFFLSRLRAAGWLLLAGSWVSLEGWLPRFGFAREGLLLVPAAATC